MNSRTSRSDNGGRRCRQQNNSNVVFGMKWFNVLEIQRKSQENCAFTDKVTYIQHSHLNYNTIQHTCIRTSHTLGVRAHEHTYHIHTYTQFYPNEHTYHIHTYTQFYPKTIIFPIFSLQHVNGTNNSFRAILSQIDIIMVLLNFILTAS